MQDVHQVEGLSATWSEEFRIDVGGGGGVTWGGKYRLLGNVS